MNPFGKQSNTPMFQQLGMFYGFVSLMQLYDIIFWDSLKTNGGFTQTNKITTMIAMITNHLQPLVLAYLISRITTLHTHSIWITMVYAVIALIYSTDVGRTLDYTVVTKKSQPSLHWKWNTPNEPIIPNRMMYGLFLITMVIVVFELPSPIRYIVLSTIVLTFAFSFYVYKSTLVGRMWCYIGAYMPLLIWGSQWVL
jgi:hypothetical protein